MVSATFMISYILILLKVIHMLPKLGVCEWLLFAKKEGGVKHGSKRSSEKT